mmetsp:Transcript_41032/g.135952  ORF Transcript_41032/g.135952 Transcript_41032/m.135952 type:complete len:212 (-) Transcript_41032:27-662(-)
MVTQKQRTTAPSTVCAGTNVCGNVRRPNRRVHHQCLSRGVAPRLALRRGGVHSHALAPGRRRGRPLCLHPAPPHLRRRPRKCGGRLGAARADGARILPPRRRHGREWRRGGARADGAVCAGDAAGVCWPRLVPRRHSDAGPSRAAGCRAVLREPAKSAQLAGSAANVLGQDVLMTSPDESDADGTHWSRWLSTAGAVSCDVTHILGTHRDV